MCSSASAQKGYIYVHTSTLDEGSNPVNGSFGFSVTGATNTIPDFTLNDAPDAFGAVDIGACTDGRLYAIADPAVTPGSYQSPTGSGRVYFRNANSSAWNELPNAPTSVATRIDGGLNGNAIFTDGNNIWLTDGSAIALVTKNTNANTLGSITDVAFDRINNNIVCADQSGNIFWAKVDAASKTVIDGSWTMVSGNITFSNIDIDASGNLVGTGYNDVYLIKNYFSNNPVTTGLGSVGQSLTDVACADDGSIFLSAGNNAVYKYNSGTSWNQEPIIQFVSRMTGGDGGELWTLYYFPSQTPVPTTIWTHIVNNDGSVTYLDDERIRTTPVNSNSALIPVNPGRYTIKQNELSGWYLQKISLSDPTNNSAQNVAANSATIDVSDGEIVNVVFQNALLNPTEITNSCDPAHAYKEDFGAGTPDVVSPINNSIKGSTSYHPFSYSSATSTGPNDGYYALATNTAVIGFNLGQSTLYDHTSGDGKGNFLFFNAGYQKDVFYEHQFTGLVVGMFYTFSYWVVNTDPVSSNYINPNILAQVTDHTTGTVLNAKASGDITNSRVWQQVKFTFQATSSSVDLILSNQNPGGSGNDLAIDDISFLLAPPDLTNFAYTVGAVSSAGTAAVTITSPVSAHLRYSLTGPAGPFQASNIFTNVSIGHHTLYVTYDQDTYDCIAQSTTDIEVLPSISGTVFDDKDGGTIDGTPMQGITVTLLNTDGSTKANTTTDANGNYEFSKVNPDSYIVAVTTPSNFVNVSSTDNSQDGKTGVSVLESNATGIDFGIDQAPVSDTVFQKIPNTLLDNYLIAEGSITAPTSGNDAEQGTLNNNAPIKIIDLPTNAIMYYNGAIVNSGQQINAFDPAKLSFKNISHGSTSLTFTYSYIDEANVTSFTPAPYTISWDPLTGSITGTVFDDKDGGTVNGNPLTGITVTLLNADGSTKTTAVTDANGKYDFLKIDIGSYNVAVTTPANFVNVSSTDNSRTGQVPVTVVNNAVVMADFGIDQAPFSDNVSQKIPDKSVSKNSIAEGSITAPTSGSDAEQGTLDNNAPIKIIGLPANAVMYYDGAAVNAGQQINDFDPSKLSFQSIAQNDTAVSFTYSYLDEADVVSFTAAAYVISWDPFLKFGGIAGCINYCNWYIINWTIPTEVNVSKYLVQESANDIDFTTVSEVDAKNINGSEYSVTITSPAKNSYHRIVAVSNDNDVIYSDTLSNRWSKCTVPTQLYVFPNPVSAHRNSGITVQATGTYQGSAWLMITNLNGKILYRKNVSVTAGKSTFVLPSMNLPQGMYIISLQLPSYTFFNADAAKLIVK